MEEIKHVPLGDVIPPEFIARFSFNEKKDIEFLESIRELGILEPLLVTSKNSKFEIIAGHRRYIAAGKLGLQSVPCIVKTVSEAEKEKIKIHENIKRDDLSHIDQAVTFLHLIEKFGMTETEVAVVIGKTVAYVSQHLCLLKSDIDLVKSVQSGKINFTVGRELMQVKDPEKLKKLMKFAIDDGVSSTVVKHWVEEANRVEIPQNIPEDQEQSSPPPQLSNEPGFKCPACDEWHVVTKLVVVRLCETCNYDIFRAIKHERSKISENKDS